MFHTRKNAILDVVITDKHDMIQNMTDLGVFPNGDHSALSWCTVVRTKMVKKSERKIYHYPNADISGIRRELQMTDWQKLFGTTSAEESWSTFKRKLHELESQYVPVKTTRSVKPKPLLSLIHI